MNLFTEPIQKDTCCLCGSTHLLSGEHKIKKSIIKSQFGISGMSIMRQGEGAKYRLAQGPKSKEFHFNIRICNKCNSHETQSSDLEFDRFLEKTKQYYRNKIDLHSVFESEYYINSPVCYLNVFRYFAKLLSLHIADAGGPRFLDVSAFALGRSEFNPIQLWIDEDKMYKQFAVLLPSIDYAAHGGLFVIRDNETGLPSKLGSTLTFGPIRYGFQIYMKEPAQAELREDYPEFIEKIKSAPVFPNAG